MEALLTTRDIATRAHVDPSTVRRWVDEGRLDATVTPGGQYRFTEEAAAAVLTPARKDEAASSNHQAS